MLDPDSSLIDAIIKVLPGGSISVDVGLAPGYGNVNCGIYINNQLIRTIFVAEGIRTKLTLPALPIIKNSTNKQSLTVVRFDNSDIQTPTLGVIYSRSLDEKYGVANSSIDYIWPYENYALGEPHYLDNNTEGPSAQPGPIVTDTTDVVGSDITDLTNPLTDEWNIQDLLFAQVNPDSAVYTRGYLTADIFSHPPDTDGHTVSVYIKNSVQILAYGSGFPNSLIELQSYVFNGVNSGVVGSVRVGHFNYSFTLDLFFRWPASINFYRRRDPFTHGFTGTDGTDSSNVLIQNVKFTGQDVSTWIDPTILSTETYLYQTQVISDTGAVGPLSQAQEIFINVAPGPASNIIFITGNRFSPQIAWIASPTPGCVYNIYIRNPPVNGYSNFDTNSPSVNHFNGTGLILPVLQNGISTILIRAVNPFGKEENQGTTIDLDFENDIYVPLRPNIPNIMTTKVDQHSCAVVVSYNPNGQLGVATQIQLFISSSSGIYPALPVAIAGITGGYFNRSSFNLTGLSDGYHFLVARSLTALGVQSFESTEVSFLVLAETNLQSGFTPHQSRG